MRSKLTLMLVALLSLVTGPTRADVPVDQSTGAIDMTVPTNLGSMTAETSGQTTDLYAFLNFYLKDNPRPAYIKLTLMPGGEYTCSQPLQINTAFTLEGDANEPAKIMGSSWNRDFIQIGGKNPGNIYKDANGFYNTMYKVEIKNLTAYCFDNLFNSNGKKHLIPNLTIDNCCYTGLGFLKFEGGGAVENVTMSNSTFWGDFDYLYDANGGTSLSAAGINSQKFNVSNCTILAFYGFRYASSATDELSKISVTFKNNICVNDNIANFVNSLNANPFAIIQNNAFQNYVKKVGEGWICQDQSAVAETFGASGTIKGNLIFAKYTGSDGQYSASDNAMYVGNMNFTLGDCPQRNAGIGDPRWILSYYTVNPDNKNQFDDDNDLAKVINNAVKAGYTEIVLGQNQYGNARYYLKQPIVADKAISIVAADKNIQIDASQNTGAFILMSKTPGVKANAKNFYEAGKLILKDLNVQGVNSYIYDDNKVAYAFEEFVVDNCVFELTNNKQDIDAPFRFQAGGPVQFALTNSTLYQTGSNGYKYFVKISSGNFPDKAFESFDGPYTWVIENNTFYKTILCGSGQKMEFLSGGRVANNYKKTAVSLQNNIFYECSDASKKDGFLKNLFGGKSSAKDMADFVSIATNYNTYYCNGAIAGLDKYDKGYMLTGNPKFKNPAEGDLTLSHGSQQAKVQTGDPRWLVDYAPSKFSELVEDALADVESGAVTMTLFDSYTVDAPIVVPAGKQLTIDGAGNSLTLGGNTNFNIADNFGLKNMTIDAAALTKPLVQMSAIPAAAASLRAANEKGFEVVNKIAFENIEVSNLKYQFFYANKQKYLVNEMTVDNSIIGIDGTNKKTIFDFNGGGLAQSLTVTNSTIWANPTNDQNGGFYNTQSGSKIDDAGAEKLEVAILNSTIYNIAKGKTTSSLRQNSQDAEKFIVKNSIIADCGKEGQFYAGLNAGSKGKETNYEIDGNSVTFNGMDVNETEQSKIAGVILNNITALPNFADAANGDFTQSNVAAGDPRWISGTPTAIETVKTAEETSLENAVIYNLNGQRVDKAQAKGGVFIVNGKKVIIK